MPGPTLSALTTYNTAASSDNKNLGTGFNGNRILVILGAYGTNNPLTHSMSMTVGGSAVTMTNIGTTYGNATGGSYGTTLSITAWLSDSIVNTGTVLINYSATGASEVMVNVWYSTALAAATPAGSRIHTGSSDFDSSYSSGNYLYGQNLPPASGTTSTSGSFYATIFQGTNFNNMVPFVNGGTTQNVSSSNSRMVADYSTTYRWDSGIGGTSASPRYYNNSGSQPGNNYYAQVAFELSSSNVTITKPVPAMRYPLPSLGNTIGTNTIPSTILSNATSLNISGMGSVVAGQRLLLQLATRSSTLPHVAGIAITDNSSSGITWTNIDYNTHNSADGPGNYVGTSTWLGTVTATRLPGTLTVTVTGVYAMSWTPFLYSIDSPTNVVGARAAKQNGSVASNTNFSISSAQQATAGTSISTQVISSSNPYNTPTNGVVYNTNPDAYAVFNQSSNYASNVSSMDYAYRNTTQSFKNANSFNTIYAMQYLELATAAFSTSQTQPAETSNAADSNMSVSAITPVNLTPSAAYSITQIANTTYTHTAPTGSGNESFTVTLTGTYPANSVFQIDLTSVGMFNADGGNAGNIAITANTMSANIQSPLGLATSYSAAYGPSYKYNPVMLTSTVATTDPTITVRLSGTGSATATSLQAGVVAFALTGVDPVSPAVGNVSSAGSNLAWANGNTLVGTKNPTMAVNRPYFLAISRASGMTYNYEAGFTERASRTFSSSPLILRSYTSDVIDPTLTLTSTGSTGPMSIAALEHKMAPPAEPATASDSMTVVSSTSKTLAAENSNVIDDVVVYSTTLDNDSSSATESSLMAIGVAQPSETPNASESALLQIEQSATPETGAATDSNQNITTIDQKTLAVESSNVADSTPNVVVNTPTAINVSDGVRAYDVNTANAKTVVNAVYTHAGIATQTGGTLTISNNVASLAIGDRIIIISSSFYDFASTIASSSGLGSPTWTLMSGTATGKLFVWLSSPITVAAATSAASVTVNSSPSNSASYPAGLLMVKVSGLSGAVNYTLSSVNNNVGTSTTSYAPTQQYAGSNSFHIFSGSNPGSVSQNFSPAATNSQYHSFGSAATTILGWAEDANYVASRTWATGSSANTDFYTTAFELSGVGQNFTLVNEYPYVADNATAFAPPMISPDPESGNVADFANLIEVSSTANENSTTSDSQPNVYPVSANNADNANAGDSQSAVSTNSTDSANTADSNNSYTIYPTLKNWGQEQGANLLTGQYADSETGAALKGLGSGATVVRTSTQSHSGIYSTSVVPLGTSAPIPLMNNAVFLPVDAGETYTLAVWIKSDSGSPDVNWYVRIRNSSVGIDVLSPGTLVVGNGGPWTLVSFNWTAPINATNSVQLLVVGSANTQGFTWYVDDLFFGIASQGTPQRSTVNDDMTAFAGVPTSMGNEPVSASDSNVSTSATNYIGNELANASEANVIRPRSGTGHNDDYTNVGDNMAVPSAQVPVEDQANLSDYFIAAPATQPAMGIEFIQPFDDIEVDQRRLRLPTQDDSVSLQDYLTVTWYRQLEDEVGTIVSDSEFMLTDPQGRIIRNWTPSEIISVSETVLRLYITQSEEPQARDILTSLTVSSNSNKEFPTAYDDWLPLQMTSSVGYNEAVSIMEGSLPLQLSTPIPGALSQRTHVDEHMGRPTSVLGQANANDPNSPLYDRAITDETFRIYDASRGNSTTDEFWSIDGISLSQPQWNIRTVGGSRYGLPNMRGDDIQVAYRPGRIWVPKTPDSRIITLIMWMVAIDPNTGLPPTSNQLIQWNDNWNFLRRLFFTPKRQRTLTRRWKLNRYSPRIDKASAKVQIGSTMEPQMTGRTRAEFSVDLVLSDPYFYGTQITETVPVTTNTATPNIRIINQPGDDTAGSANMIVTFYGPLVNPRLVNKSGANGDIWMRLNTNVVGTIPAGRYVTFNLENSKAVKDDGTIVTSAITHSGATTFFAMEPGENVVVLEGDAGSTSGYCTIRYSPPYI